MGKRKKGKKAAPQKPLFMRMKIPTTFKCPFCNTEESVECKMFVLLLLHAAFAFFFFFTPSIFKNSQTPNSDRKNDEARMRCSGCGAGYDLHHLSALTEPVDVYCMWLDDLKAKNAETAKETTEPEAAGLDYDVPADDAWQRADDGGDDDVSDDDAYGLAEDDDDADEPPAKKRSGGSSREDEELQKVAEAVGNDEYSSVLKDVVGSDDDDDEEDDE